MWLVSIFDNYSYLTVQTIFQNPFDKPYIFERHQSVQKKLTFLERR